MSEVVAQLSMLMKPGVTASPAASISERPRSGILHRADAVAVDRDVRGERRGARSVVDRATAEDDVVARVHPRNPRH